MKGKDVIKKGWIARFFMLLRELVMGDERERGLDFEGSIKGKGGGGGSPTDLCPRFGP